MTNRHKVRGTITITVNQPGLWAIGKDREPNYDRDVFACEMHNGFDLPAFDEWLETLPEGDLLKYMRKRRDEALEAIYSNQHDQATLLLQNLRDNMERVVLLIPLARVGDKAQKQRRKAGFSSGNERRDQRAATWEKWQRLADEVWRKRPALSNAAVANRIAECTGGNPDTIRRRIKHPFKK